MGIHSTPTVCVITAIIPCIHLNLGLQLLLQLQPSCTSSAYLCCNRFLLPTSRLTIRRSLFLLLFLFFFLLLIGIGITMLASWDPRVSVALHWLVLTSKVMAFAIRNLSLASLAEGSRANRQARLD